MFTDMHIHAHFAVVDGTDTQICTHTTLALGKGRSYQDFSCVSVTPNPGRPGHSLSPAWPRAHTRSNALRRDRAPKTKTPETLRSPASSGCLIAWRSKHHPMLTRR